MIIGIPTEIKDHEARVGATPETVHQLISHGHLVKIQSQAGKASGFCDASYHLAGAQVVSTAQEAYDADLIVKVKEPQPVEFPYFKKGQMLFSYLHLVVAPLVVQALLEAQVVAIAYETVVDKRGKLPLLQPMSAVAGRLAIQVGATALQTNHGGRGILLGGVPGTKKGKVVILGGGVSGSHAAHVAIGMGADVTVFDQSLEQLEKLHERFGSSLKVRYASPLAIEEELSDTDLLIGAVLLPGRRTPHLISEKDLKKMQNGSVMVDISIDQGGFCETSRPTTFSSPTYVTHGVIHSCITNLPSGCARTSTQALTSATLAYLLALANKGWKKALQEDCLFAPGLQLCLGHVVDSALAYELGYSFVDPDSLLK